MLIFQTSNTHSGSSAVRSSTEITIISASTIHKTSPYPAPGPGCESIQIVGFLLQHANLHVLDALLPPPAEVLDDVEEDSVLKYLTWGLLTRLGGR